MTDADLIRLIVRVGYSPLGDEDGATAQRLLKIATRLDHTEPTKRTHDFT